MSSRRMGRIRPLLLAPILAVALAACGEAVGPKYPDPKDPNQPRSDSSGPVVD